ncbi:ABC transporter permease [Rhizobium subbaraonis]|uniref:ABC transporter permease n=1 Tax=Rhizobium subbaraonis TaxID=908946 RepID=UPI001AECCF1F|nr:ABC transporter permease [Rhizobium subbaraonis]
MAPAIILIGGLFLIPVGQLIILSFDGFAEPSLQFYRQIMATESIHRIILTTLRITALTSIIAVVLAYIVAYALAHMGPRQRMLLLLCVLIPFWLSVLVRALSWLILLRNNGLVNSALLETGLIGSPLPLVRNETGVIIGMVHYLVPYAVFPIYAAMQSLDSRVFMAARSVGGRPWRVFFDVYLPLTVPSVLGAGLLVFVFGLGFFITPAILGGGRVVMLSEYVSISVLQTVRWGLAAALSVLLLVTTLALIALVRRFAGAGKLLGAAR